MPNQAYRVSFAVMIVAGLFGSLIFIAGVLFNDVYEMAVGMGAIIVMMAALLVAAVTRDKSS